MLNSFQHVSYFVRCKVTCVETVDTMNWIKEREQWIQTCKNLQHRNYELELMIQRLQKDIHQMKTNHNVQLDEKDKLIHELDKQIKRLEDDIRVLELENYVLSNQSTRTSNDTTNVLDWSSDDTFYSL